MAARTVLQGVSVNMNDVTKLNGLGWKAKIPLKLVEKAYQWYLQFVASF